MNFNFKHWAMALLFVTVGSANCWAQGQGTVTCNVVAGSVTHGPQTYVFGGANALSVSVPVTCTHAGATANNGNTVKVTVDIGNSNNAPTTIQNTATRSGFPTINYDFYTNSGCGTEIHTTPATVNIILTKNQVNVPGNATAVLCIPVPVAFASGAYSDTVTTKVSSVALVSGGATLVAGTGTGAISVNIFIPERCAITMSTGALVFNYTSFSTIASQPSKTYSVTCGSSLSPTMALTDVNGAALTSGTAAGLAYTLALNTMANSTGGTPTLAVASGGAATNYRINGNMVAGQAGSCAAPAVQAGATCTQTITGVHYLTVTW